MRIVLVLASFYPIVGGGETHALLLARELTARGVEVLILTRRTTPDLPRRETIQGIPVIRVPPARFKRWGKYIMLAPVLWQLLRLRKRYDLILVSGLRILGVAGMLASRLLRKPCILRAASCGELSGDFIWNSPRPVSIRQPLAKKLIQALLRRRDRLFLQAAGFLAISKAIADEYLACGVPFARIRTINNGTDINRFRPVEVGERASLRSRLGLPADKKIFAYAGKLNRGKGLEFLLRAWARLAGKRPEAYLLLIGAGANQFLSCEAALRSQAREMGLEGSVTFTGYVENVFEYLQASDCFVFPSENESLSNALIEASACGLPCLASNVGGIPDTIVDGRTGRLLPSGDEAAWAEAMAALLDQPAQAAAWGRSGRERMLERNGMPEVAARHLEFFGEVLREAHAKAR